MSEHWSETRAKLLLDKLEHASGPIFSHLAARQVQIDIVAAELRKVSDESAPRDSIDM